MAIVESPNSAVLSKKSDDGGASLPLPPIGGLAVPMTAVAAEIFPVGENPHGSFHPLLFCSGADL
ncbi:hypothetical protein [Aquamicrobium defluvii]|uniref:hypothetical protein n=1 Tax=Aquamicrobium defluvii TaxID=69279 RepID=UPI000445906F|nr:hypothetical protein [Aquamicrobium defluvii]EZQ16776.1 hypothetical protein CF98_39640 [Halopseudomonas bauzanensis]